LTDASIAPVAHDHDPFYLFMACAEKFGYAGGRGSMVSYYLFENSASLGARSRIT